MLASLTIHNIVLIDRLTLEGEAGLSALTGETGAGKSILLDALGLALGARAEAGLVRHGEEQATVTACFDLPPKHPVIKTLKEKGIDAAEMLILRRALNKDGRSKAFINDEPVGVQLLKEVGAELVEIHGQFDSQGLLDPETHGRALDIYAGIENDAAETRLSWNAWRDAKNKLEQAAADVETARLQEEYLRYAVAELKKLNPRPGEEGTLAEKRSFLMNAGKMHEAFDLSAEILEGDDGVQNLLGKMASVLERVAKNATPLMETLTRAKIEIEELSSQVEKFRNGSGDRESLEEIEDRYFALKECAKKHRCTADDLPRIHDELSQRLKLATNREEALADLNGKVSAAKKKFAELAGKISDKRLKAAQKLSRAVNAELPDLKLDKAKFFVSCVKNADEKDWGPEGFDTIRFTVSTNANTAAGPIHKIASGGELSRFMLALKLVLSGTGSVPTLVFDEVDSGIGGATADAVGERLARLAEKYQVLAVTHSPQVASRAAHHWIVSKTEQKGAVITKITALKVQKERQEEIARMISGAKITAEARAAALKLLESHAA